MKKAPQPAALGLLYRLRAFSLTYWEGSYASQPYILMRELEAALVAEQEYEALKAANELAKLKAKISGRTT